MRQGAGYGLARRILHWLTAGLVAALFGFGLWIVLAPPADGTARHTLYNVHESLGATVLALTVARLGTRVARGGPGLPAATPRAARLAAGITQAALYALLLAQPAFGFLAANAWGAPLRWFELFAIPSPIGRAESLAPTLSALHLAGAILLGALIALHVAGAAWHGVIRRDGVFTTMWRGHARP